MPQVFFYKLLYITQQIPVSCPPIILAMVAIFTRPLIAVAVPEDLAELW